MHNAKREFPRYGIQAFPQIVQTLGSILGCFLDVLQGMDASFIDQRILETWSCPSAVGKTPVGGMDMTRPRMRAVAAAVLALAADHRGFTAAQVAAKVQEIRRIPPQAYRPTQAAYDLKKMRAKDLVCRLACSRRYTCTDHGHRSLAAFDAIYTKVLLPLLANAGTPTVQLGEPVSEIDSHYERIRTGMQGLFVCLGLSAAG